MSESRIFSVQNVLDPDDPITWSFSLSASWPGQLDPKLDPAGRLSILKKKVGESCGEPLSLLLSGFPMKP
jgi:hypothetical protein